jgi:penicillin-binding protein 2
LASVARPGRFLPGDPRVEEPYRLTPQLAFRVALLAFLALAVFAVLFLRLWALQVLSGDKYLAVANDNRVRTLRLEAPRGPVLDRNGNVLVENVPGTRVELWPSDLPKTWPAQRRELQALSDLTGVSLKEILAQMSRHALDPLAPIVVQRGLRQDQIFYIREHNAQFPGVRLAHSYLRKYPYQSLGAQMFGYVGQITAGQYKAMKKHGYQPTDSIGQAGIESTYDTYLRGKDGKAQLTVDSRGRRKGAITPLVGATPGQALRLTIDIGLQRAAERALVYGIQQAHNASYSHADGGAIVAMDPRDGAILAMASSPTYQPSIFVGRKDAKKLAPLLDNIAAEAANHPGINRAIDAAYPPGSTFKPVTALAAMQEHLITPSDQLLCSPSYHAYSQTFNNWTNLIDQSIDLPTALAMSCDTYFYELGKRFYLLPADRGHPLQGWANRFGLGQKTLIDVSPEASGLIPTPEWRRNAYPKSKGNASVDRTWKPGYSIQMAIGQGQITVTPLQMTRLYALIANGGKLVTPHIADDVEIAGAKGQPIRLLRRFGAQPPQPTGVDPTALSYVQRGLLEATHSPIGTSAGVFGTFPVDIAGKTGSAEKNVTLPGFAHAIPQVQSWWCGYGPYNQPTIVVCALIENGGHGGTSAAPAALKVFERYFGKNGQLTNHLSD